MAGWRGKAARFGVECRPEINRGYALQFDRNKPLAEQQIPYIAVHSINRQIAARAAILVARLRSE
jgi:hypothetical protein